MLVVIRLWEINKVMQDYLKLCLHYVVGLLLVPCGICRDVLLFQFTSGETRNQRKSFTHAKILLLNFRSRTRTRAPDTSSNIYPIQLH